jgi:hypothetical protein
MLSAFSILASMTCHCVVDKRSDARTRETTKTLGGTRSGSTQTLPFCASDLLVVLTIVCADLLLEDCAAAAALADGCALLPYQITWAIHAYSFREAAEVAQWMARAGACSRKATTLPTSTPLPFVAGCWGQLSEHAMSGSAGEDWMAEKEVLASCIGRSTSR